MGRVGRIPGLWEASRGVSFTEGRGQGDGEGMSDGEDLLPDDLYLPYEIKDNDKMFAENGGELMR